MDDVALNFKVNLALALEKSGSSLEDLEKDFAENNVDSVVEKIALAGDLLSSLGNLAVNTPQALLALGVLAGTGGGSALYAIDSHLAGQDDRLDNKKKEINELKGNTDTLRLSHQLK